MKTIRTTRFGDVSVNDDGIIAFPHGIPAFESHREWAILGDESSAIKWLQSMTDPDTALPVCSPGDILTNYNAKLLEADLEDLAMESEQDLALLLVLSVPPDAPRDMTVNLRAPIVVNHVKRIALQAIAENEDYGMAHRVFGDNQDAGPVA